MMFPAALTIPAAIPPALNLTLEFGPLLLLVVLALLDIGALAVLRAAMVSSRMDRAANAVAARGNVTPLQRPSSLPHRTTARTSPPRAA